MKIQVNDSQFIETDEIIFAEASLNGKRTNVYLRGLNGHNGGYITVNSGYDQFVDRLNRFEKTGSNELVIIT